MKNGFSIRCCPCFASAYQIIAGYEDVNDADRLRHDPAFQILADQPLGEPLGSQPTLSRWENAPSARELIALQDALLDWFVKVCGKQVRKRGEILLDVDSTDDPTHGQQQLSFFNGGYDQYMYHPLLIFERHTGCLFRLQSRQSVSLAAARVSAIGTDRNATHTVVQDWGTHPANGSLRPYSFSQRLALSRSLRDCRHRLQLLVL
jgi:DDE family transposase